VQAMGTRLSEKGKRWIFSCVKLHFQTGIAILINAEEILKLSIN
jgi:hypothetical protein